MPSVAEPVIETPERTASTGFFTEGGLGAVNYLSKASKEAAAGPALTLHYSDIDLFADELAGYGPEVLVEAPDELRAAVSSRLERTAADHG